MNRIAHPHLTTLAVATALAAAVLTAAPAARAEGIPATGPVMKPLAANYSCGPISGSDGAIAAQLNPVLTGNERNSLTAYRISCARAIVNTVQSRGLPQRAAVLAVTTAIVESDLSNIPGGDLDSVGLFQQRDSWGTFNQRMDPTWSTNAFLNELLTVRDWQTRPIGEVCQAVQRSGFPYRYQPQASDGETIANALLSSASGDQPVAGNWDGGPAGNVGVFRPSTGQFHLRFDSTGQFHLRNDDGSLAVINWGEAGDIPVAGNWDGGAATNVGIWRPSTGQFHLRFNDGSLHIVDWGQAGDIPVSGNWDGGPAGNVGVFRPSTGQFHLRFDDGSLHIVDWGQAGDIPVSANFDGAGPDNIGIWRPSTGQFHLRNDDGGLVVLDWGQPR
ncbi:hypothetical protein [Streptomyces sp. NRRL WC-3742]|uniref:hypothetical protein n=1 Tax=Streptomyces sp. NRRL WC-3742 TaxID=1463934 RepID=UPI00068A0777|nr:hypothetical protein [Streptomyces sp. NRRL WC-3742]